MLTHSLTVKGLICQPQWVWPGIQNVRMDKGFFKPRDVLALNLKALMAAKVGPTSQSELKRRSGVAQATIGRILSKDVAPTTETLAQIAEAYGLEGWQLMVPGMEPTNPPTLMPVSKEEKAFHDQIRAAFTGLAKLQK